MTSATMDKALLEQPDAAKTPQSPAIVRVARDHGVSPLRQLRETFALRFGANKLQSKDYYDNQLFLPSMAMDQKREFVGVTGNNALNARLSPPKLIPTGAFVGNKVLFTALLNQLGLATTQTLAVASKNGSFGAIPVLRDAAALQKFLRDPAQYPIFGKPRHGSLSVGSVLLTGVDTATGQLTMGSGRSVDIDAFCAEVMREFGGGFILQRALTQHDTLAKVTGTAVGCVRIVTAIHADKPKAVYGVWKIPSPTAMSDNFWQDGSMLAHVELETGKVLTCRRGTGLDTEDITHHPVSGEPIVGMTVPHWSNAIKLAQDTHAVFAEFGAPGWDVAITPDGPKIIEMNDNPFHMLYQLAARRGILNADLAPIWKAVETKQKAKLDRVLKAK